MTPDPLKQFILRALLRMDDVPMPDRTLVDYGLMSQEPRPPLADVETARNRLEVSGHITAVDDEITGRHWSLTTKGKLAARALPPLR